jgi:hypothetical protein
MTRRMQEFIDRLRALPEKDQDDVAAFFLNELEEDKRWARTAEKHADKLKKLADQVLADDAKGLCEPLDPDRL